MATGEVVFGHPWEVLPAYGVAFAGVASDQAQAGLGGLAVAGPGLLGAPAPRAVVAQAGKGGKARAALIESEGEGVRGGNRGSGRPAAPGAAGVVLGFLASRKVGEGAPYTPKRPGFCAGRALS